MGQKEELERARQRAADMRSRLSRKKFTFLITKKKKKIIHSRGESEKLIFIIEK